MPVILFYRYNTGISLFLSLFHPLSPSLTPPSLIFRVYHTGNLPSHCSPSITNFVNHSLVFGPSPSPSPSHLHPNSLHPSTRPSSILPYLLQVPLSAAVIGLVGFFSFPTTISPFLQPNIAYTASSPRSQNLSFLFLSFPTCC
ncbi:hypothetical protein HOY82DRAFT_295672 [Tuber indicum]|nr:hypothetical protein HOY82DRAFT_295672 [Tuber indicum]